MSESRRIHLYSLILPLGLCLVILFVNPNFIYKLFVGGLGLLISLTYLLALVYIGLTLQQHLDTPRNASISALLGILAMTCVLGGPPLISLFEVNPLPSVQFVILAVLIVIDIALSTANGAVFARMQRIS